MRSDTSVEKEAGHGPGPGLEAGQEPRAVVGLHDKQTDSIRVGDLGTCTCTYTYTYTYNTV